MNYWWVSQNTTYKEERNGGYLWAPIRNEEGSSFFHWTNLKLVQPGDVIFSHVKGEIVAISRATSAALPHEKPVEFKSSEANWEAEGNIVYADYQDLMQPIAVPSFPDTLKSSLSVKGKHLPLNKDGECNQGYLFKVPEEEAKYILQLIEANNTIQLEYQSQNHIKNHVAESVTTYQVINHSLLDILKPTERLRIMDLVAEAGVDVSDWYNQKGNKSPASNPRYCFEWCFTGPNQPIVLCLWYSKMLIDSDGNIYQKLNLREDVLEMERKSEAGIKIARARKMDNILKQASREQVSVRVVVLDGNSKLKTTDYYTPDVDYRKLDSDPWRVDYDMQTGNCKITRNAPSSKFIDQFSIQGAETPARKQTSTTVYERLVAVRNHALQRANGRCEYCDEAGFETVDGRLYLETHHVWPMSEGGPDTVDNVIAICPSHHREAHHGNRKDELGREYAKIISMKETKR